MRKKSAQDANMNKILVIEDDESMLKSIRRALVLEGYHVLGAENGLVAIHLLQDNPVDLVITDIFMPYKDGIDTVMDIKSKFPAIKIIVISGGGSIDGVDFLDLAEKVGADCSFQKPFDPQDLVSAVHELLL